jgi:hypothetical protein
MNEHYYKVLGVLDAYLSSPGVIAVTSAATADPHLKAAYTALASARDQYRAEGDKVCAAVRAFDEAGGSKVSGIGKLIFDSLTVLKQLTFPAAGPFVACALNKLYADIKGTGPVMGGGDSDSNMAWPRSSS